MRSRLFYRGVLLFLCILGLSATAAYAEAVQIVFCKNFSDSWEPQGQTETFDSNVITWIAKSQEPFGVQQLSLSLYKRQGEQEQLLKRENLDVRPTWNTFGLRNMVLPGEGTYLLSLAKGDGKVIGEGVVVVTAVQKDTASVKTEARGTTLAELFEKYAPKQDKKGE
ncbi:MAG: hypothetical protein LBQ10_00840 [Desulfovibrio sp.]|jgi:hypothetical protein|nr:hypothetical protein [Desulfovibrio sp.]